MKKLLFAVFAHPDDEAFGPAATLLQETDAGTELHLVLLTAGENGNNPDNHDDLAAVRLAEWRASGALLGASSQTFFDYVDGSLSNTAMQEITKRLIDHITDTAADADEIELMSYEFGGISGHIDHIVAARATAQAYCKLKRRDQRFSRLRLFCIPKHLRPARDTSWIFSEAGYAKDDIDQVVDARQLRPRLEAVIATHASQASDAAYIKKLLGEELGVNWFKIIE